LDVLAAEPRLLESPAKVRSVRITIYEPAFSIIGDSAKRDPRTRQSADHSMVYIIATLLRKAFEQKRAGWRELMLMPSDYVPAALFHPLTRELMERIEFRHGGAEYDRKYPDGIPTTFEVEHDKLGWLTSGLVMYPEGHARSTSGKLDELLSCKFQRLAEMAVDDADALHRRFSDLRSKSAADVAALNDFEIRGDELGD
jgi:2-methylcitrate dehydratase